jgi:hypothetical protein
LPAYIDEISEGEMDVLPMHMRDEKLCSLETTWRNTGADERIILIRNLNKWSVKE